MQSSTGTLPASQYCVNVTSPGYVSGFTQQDVERDEFTNVDTEWDIVQVGTIVRTLFEDTVDIRLDGWHFQYGEMNAWFDNSQIILNGDFNVGTILICGYTLEDLQEISELEHKHNAFENYLGMVQGEVVSALRQTLNERLWSPVENEEWSMKPHPRYGWWG